MTVSHAVSVCAGAAALVLFAHVVVFLLHRRARLDQEPYSPVVTVFGFGVCALALSAVVLSLGDASQLGDVLLLLGTGAGVMAAAIPLLPAFSPRREPARTRQGGPRLPRTSLAGQLDASGRAPSTARSQPHHAGKPGPNDHRSQRAQPTEVVAREAYRLGLTTSRPPALDAPTMPITRIDVSAPRPGPSQLTNQDEPQPRAPVREATETLVQLDRVVDDLTGALHLGRRDPV